MPIRRELRSLYPPNWKELSRRVRFDRARGLCEVCGRCAHYGMTPMRNNPGVAHENGAIASERVLAFDGPQL